MGNTHISSKIKLLLWLHLLFKELITFFKNMLRHINPVLLQFITNCPINSNFVVMMYFLNWCYRKK